MRKPAMRKMQNNKTKARHRIAVPGLAVVKKGRQFKN